MSTLADLMLLEGSEELRDEWIRQSRIRWAGYRSRSAEARGDDGAWLDGDAAAAVACDALVAPVVWGQVNPSVFADLVRLCADLDKVYRHGLARREDAAAEAAGTGRTANAEQHDGQQAGAAGRDRAGGAGAGGHRQVRGTAVRARRAGLLRPPAAARRPAGRSQPAPGPRRHHDHPGLHQEPGPAPRPALPLPRLPPARRRLRCPSHPPQSQRRPHQPRQLRAAMPVPPPDRHPPPGLDPHPQTPTAPPPPGTRTRPRSCAATARPPAPGNTPGRPCARAPSDP